MNDDQQYTLEFYRATKGKPEDLLAFVASDPARFQHKLKLIIGAYATLAIRAEGEQGISPN